MKKNITEIIKATIAINNKESGVIPFADCKNCEFMKLPHEIDTHCYMFEDKPGNYCAQFKQ